MRLRKRRYHTGGGIPPHPHPHTGIYADVPEDLDVLQSIVPDTTQEPDALRVDMPGLQTGINIIEDPEVAQMKTFFKDQYGDDWEKKYDEFNQKIAEQKAEDDVKTKQIMIGQFQNPFYDQGPLGADEVFKRFQEEKGYKPGTFYSPKEAENILFDSKFYSTLDPNLRGSGAIQMAGPFDDPIFGLLLGGQQVVRSSLGAGLNWLYKPMLKKIPGLGGVTGHHILSALGLHHMVKETPKSIQEFIDNPSPGQALHVTWDALMGVPGMIELKKGIPASISAFQNSKNLAKFRRGPDGLGSFLWDDAAKNWKKMSQAEIDWLVNSLAQSPKLIGALTESTEGGAALQQTGALGQLAASDASVAASEAGLFGNKLTFKGLRDFFLPKPDLTLQSEQFSLSNKMTDAMLEGEKFASQYYLNANTLDRLGSLYGPLGTNQLYDLGLNKTFDNITSNLKAKDFSYTYPGGSITYSGDQLQNQIKKLYTERAIWATSGIEGQTSFLGSRLFPFELSKMTSTGGGGNVGGGRLQGSYGTYANRHFPGVLVRNVGGMGRSYPFSSEIKFTPAEILTTYAKEPFGVHPDDFKQSLIDVYGPVEGLEKYENIGGLRYQVNNEAGNLTRIYGLKSFPERVIDPETGFKRDPSRSMGSLVQDQYDNAVRTVVHEMNHYYFGMANLPNELIVPWMQYLTDEANFHLFSKYPKGKIKFDGPQSVQYYAQPVEIQARTGELRYELVSKILKNKGINLSKDTPAYDINKAIDELEIIIKRSDEDAFNKLFGGENGDIANSIRVQFRKIIKGNNFDEKRKSLFELMKVVPVVGAGLVVGSTLDEEEEDLPILGYKDGGALKFLTKKYGAGGTVEEFGSQGNFESEYKSRLPEVEEPSDPNEELLATTDPEVEEATLTEEEIKALKKKKALGAAGKGAALGASIGSAVPGIGTVIGAAAGALIGGIGSLVANKGLEDQPELIMARNGVKVHKKQKTFDEGGLLEALRQRKAERRIGRTTIQPNNPEYLEGAAGMFNQYLQEVQGIPRRSVALDPDADDSVLTHELIHSTQYGPLQQIAAELGFKNAGRIQDKDSRKAFRKLFRSLDPKTQTFNRMGEFMLGGKDQDIEFDAIIKSAISSAKKRGYDLSGKTYGEILDTLSKARDEGNISLNMKHLGNFMNSNKETGNTWTDKQKGYIMDAIKTNLDFEGYTIEDVKEDLR